MNAHTSDRPRVFVSYSHNDREWLERLRVHLKPLRSQIDLWDDTRIRPGEVWYDEIRRGLEGARAALLLVSADFLASDFITSEELPVLLRSAAEDGTDILIIVLGPSRFSAVEGLSRYQTVNDPKEPLIGLPKVRQEEVFVSAANLVELALRREAGRKAPAGVAGTVDADAPAGTVDTGDRADATGVVAATAPPVSDCRDYGNIFDIYVSREQRAIPVGYAAAALSPLFGLALILFAFAVFDFRKDPAVVSLMVAVGCGALFVSYFLWRKVAETHTAVESCKFMKRRFDGCEHWQPAELKENVQLAIEFLKREMLKS